MTVRKQKSTGEIIFPIVSLINKSNKFQYIYYKIGEVLREFDNDGVQTKQRIREPSQADTRRPEIDDSRDTKRKGGGKRINKTPDFFQDDNVIR